MKTASFLTVLAATLATAFPVSSAEETGESSTTRMTGPYVHDNLAVYLIHGKDSVADFPILTLEEALEKKLVEVKETGDVNELQIRNKSKDHYIYVLPGDIIKGGKQDRTLPNGFLMTTDSGFVPVDSFCVEQGRWSKRGGESADRFAGSTKSLAGKELKLAARYSKSQSKVWEKVAVAQEKLSRNVGSDVKAPASASSLQLTLENKDLEKMVSTYTGKISAAAEPGLDDAVGMAFAINGDFNSADSFASRELFQKLWPKLLESAATEAVGEKVKDKSFATPDSESIAASIEETESAKAEREDLAGTNFVLRREEDKSVAFDTYGGGGKAAFRVHRNVISKVPGQEMAPAPQPDLQQQRQNDPVSAEPEQAAEPEKRGLLKSIGSLFKRR